MRRFVFVLIFIAGCGNGSVTPQSAALACITASACGIPLYPRGGGANAVSACVELVPFINSPEGALGLMITPSQADCVAAAGSNCAAAKRCLAGGNTPTVCPTVHESCDGTTWNSCTSTVGSGGSFGERTFDCAAYGELCIASTADCGVGTCQPAQGACVTADGKPGGNFVEGCYGGGTTKRRDCGRLAASCIPPGLTTVAHCRGNGAACTAPATGDDTVGCDGNVLLHCLDGQLGREDCGQYKLGCFAKLSGSGYGCALGNDCDPYATAATCAGKSLTLCNNGKLQTIDCGAIGFATCDASNGGSCGV
jgi:hypothetical protein